jgi:hypothetical protein
VGVRCAAISEEPPGAPLCDESEGESESRGERRTRKDISRGYTVKISGGELGMEREKEFYYRGDLEGPSSSALLIRVN